MIIYLFNT